jgi:hypothetical protein
MAEATFKVMTCDRCGVVEELRHPYSGYDWGKILARECNGPMNIGTTAANATVTAGRDLCPACLRALDLWFKREGQSDARQT